MDDLPPLFGVATAIKDLTPTAGVRTTYGSQAFADHVPERDAYTVSLLAGAGTISLGRRTRRSSGCARTPTMTWPGPPGRRGRRIAGGPIARTVADTAAMLDALAVSMPGDPFWAPSLPPGETFLGHDRSDPGELHVARHAFPVSGVPVDPACLAAWEEVSRLLAELGHEVTDIAAPFGPETSEYFMTVLAVESLAIDMNAASKALLRPVTRACESSDARSAGRHPRCW